ncbi:MAG TPA: putative glycoside hydrolase [Clostridiaceae bacterium]
MDKNTMKKKILPIIALLVTLSLAGYGIYSLQAGKSQNTTKQTEDNTKKSASELAKLQKERDDLDAQRKTALGEFYVPLPAVTADAKKAKTIDAKALYVSSTVAGMTFDEAKVDYYAKYIKALSAGEAVDSSKLSGLNKLEKILGICEATEVNALVIDIKDDDGVVSWKSDIGIVNQIKSNASIPMKDYAKLMNYLKSKDIHTIARIVAFKDPYFAGKFNQHAIQLKAGGVYKDKAGKIWVNPFDEYVWKYLVALSEEAALRGFDEIQYDYVRFPDGASYYNPITDFPGRNGRDKDEGIEDFLKYAHKELAPYNVSVGADVFGIITHSWDDKPEDIGQTWRKIASNVDYICPMVYPSHYGPGNYNFAVPDQHPYEVVRLSMMESLERNAAQKNPGKIRPWVQGFSAAWVSGHINYDASTISKQLVASAELGINEYIIWNASNNYDPMIFYYQNKVNKNIRVSGQDILARTPEDTMKKYLDAQKAKRYSTLYLVTAITDRKADYDEFAAEMESSAETLKSYDALVITDNKDKTYTATLNGTYTKSDGTSETKQVKYKIALENDVYKVFKAEAAKAQ